MAVFYSFLNFTMIVTFSIQTEGLKTMPTKSLDPNIQVLIISGTKNPLTISPIFIPFTKLEVLQINDAYIQSIGIHSFWGVQSLRILGMHSKSSINVNSDRVKKFNRMPFGHSFYCQIYQKTT